MAGVAEDAASARRAVAELLDGWHAAASIPDGERYFACFTRDAAFLGTDASERWDVAAFKAYAEPYFSSGRGWTYVARERHIAFSADGRTAWFDERLDNEKYGELRGTGVVTLASEGWRIAHYNMCFPVPNNVTRDLVELIRAQGSGESN